MSESQIKAYQLTNDTIQKALRLLKPHLPVSIPIYRRLQFGRFFERTRLLTNLELNSCYSTDADETKPWLIAFVDRACRPETELWFFASWETKPSTPGSEAEPIDALVKDLMKTIKSLPLPDSIHQDVISAQIQNHQNDVDRVGLSRSDYVSHITNPNIMLLGAIHENTMPVLERLGFIPPEFKAGKMPNSTFIFDIDSLEPEKPLPGGLQWGNLQASKGHFALVRSRTSIPRQDRTLASLPQQAILNTDTNTPIAWTFMGLDGSLTSLHVEKEWRGQGLAKAVTKRLFNESYAPFRIDRCPNWAHGYVIDGNKESEGMCRSLGGKSDWQVYWMRVDLGRVS